VNLEASVVHYQLVVQSIVAPRAAMRPAGKARRPRIQSYYGLLDNRPAAKPVSFQRVK
jgi:hypothetical protein